MGKRGWASGSPESRLETNYTTAATVAAGMRQEMTPRLGIYNWPPVYISLGRKKVGFRLDTCN